VNRLELAEGYPMPTTEPDLRSESRKALDEQLASGPTCPTRTSLRASSRATWRSHFATVVRWPSSGS